MARIGAGDRVLKGPITRTLQQKLFGDLREDYGFPRATCRSLVDLVMEFVEENAPGKLKDGQIKFVAASEDEPPGKELTAIKTVDVFLTLHEPNDLEVLKSEGLVALRRRKIIRLSNEARDQGGLLTQQDLAALLCSATRTMKRDIKLLKSKEIIVPTRGTIRDIGPGVSHKTLIIDQWLRGYEYTDLERRTGHSMTSIMRYLKGFTKVARFHCIMKKDAEEIRMLTDHSEKLVREYLDLVEKYRHNKACKDRWELVLRGFGGEKKRPTAVQAKGRGAGVGG